MNLENEYVNALIDLAYLVDTSSDKERDKKGSRYLVDRGWFPPKFRVHGGTYETFLPTWQESNAFDLVNQVIESNKFARVLDIGCGKGKFLTDFQTMPQWRGKISCEGITGFPYHKKSLWDKYRVWKSGISITTADVHIPTSLDSEAYNLITCVKSFQHFVDPLRVLVNCYDWLSPNGVALLHTGGLRGLEDPTQRTLLYEYLRSEYGFHIKGTYDPNDQRVDLAFTKTHPRLVLPVEYDFSDQLPDWEKLALFRQQAKSLNIDDLPKVGYRVIL